MDFRVLGPVEVFAGGEVLSLGGARQRALFVLLLVHAGEPVSVDRLIEELWGERPPASAQHAVDFAAREADRLEELRTFALEGSVEAALARGENAHAIGTRTSLAANPLRERPRRLLT